MNTAEAQVTSAPLADQLRPSRWEDYCGLDQLDTGLVRQFREGRGRPPSLILWGPPGSGKTTLARLIGASFVADFIVLSAVLSGVKEVREIVEQAKSSTRPTILFIDEIHRFNKAQQDAFLPHVETGTLTLIGATTENPSFYLTGALLSRCKVLVLPSLAITEITKILHLAATRLEVSVADDAVALVANFAAGDARKAINVVESLVGARIELKSGSQITAAMVQDFLKSDSSFFHDRSGAEHYNVVSAFIKSMRGSNPDAALYWGFRMLEGGEDPRFLIRRMMIFASEDIGNADPRALQLAVATADAYERLGLPEGRIPIAHCITYLAGAPKSNRSYVAMHRAIAAVKRTPKSDVPLHLRNAPTGLMKGLGYGAEYQYPHDTEEGFAAGVSYLPDAIAGEVFYEPSQRGYEKVIGERAEYLRSRVGRT